MTGTPYRTSGLVAALGVRRVRDQVQKANTVQAGPGPDDGCGAGHLVGRRLGEGRGGQREHRASPKGLP